MSDLSEEEKKAINIIKDLGIHMYNGKSQIISGTVTKEISTAIYTTLNLIEKQEKVIDYMVDRIEWLMKSNGIVLDFEHKDNFTKEDIKEFFYRKVNKDE